jgi:hypothetical protein
MSSPIDFTYMGSPVITADIYEEKYPVGSHPDYPFVGIPIVIADIYDKKSRSRKRTTKKSRNSFVSNMMLFEPALLSEINSYIDMDMHRLNMLINAINDHGYDIPIMLQERIDTVEWGKENDISPGHLYGEDILQMYSIFIGLLAGDEHDDKDDDDAKNDRKVAKLMIDLNLVDINDPNRNILYDIGEDISTTVIKFLIKNGLDLQTLLREPELGKYLSDSQIKLLKKHGYNISKIYTYDDLGKCKKCKYVRSITDRKICHDCNNDESVNNDDCGICGQVGLSRGWKHTRCPGDDPGRCRGCRNRVKNVYVNGGYCYDCAH